MSNPPDEAAVESGATGSPGDTRAERLQAAISDNMRKVLNNSGYGFQYRTLARCAGARVDGFHSGAWRVRATELPVVLGADNFHIDGLIEFASGGQRAFAVVECKRIDPKFSQWAFARSDSATTVIGDVYGLDPATGVPFVCAAVLDGGFGKVADIGVELKAGDVTGDQTGKGLADAVTQAHRGVGGFCQCLRDWTRALGTMRVVPMVVTSANLYWTDVLMTTADSRDGRFASVPVEPTPWVWYQTHLSKSLLPAIQRRYPAGGDEAWNMVERAILHRHKRGALIVNTNHLEAALNALGNQGFDLLPA